MIEDVEIVIVGAGLAGLVAARDLIAAGRTVLVLEARDRVGGRTLNHNIGSGKVVELGGQWIGPTQNRIAALARALEIATFPTYNTGKHILHFQDKVSRFRGEIPRVNPIVFADLAQARIRFEQMARQVPLDAPWEMSRVSLLDRQTFNSWICRNTATSGARTLLQLFAEIVFAAQPSDFSLLHALFLTHSCGGIDSIVNTSKGAQQDRFVGGSQRIAIRLAEQLGERVRVQTPVRRIEQRDSAVRVVADGITVTARHVIVAIPPTLTGRLDYDPPLPADRDQLTQRVPQGTNIKCQAIYDTPFWRDEGLTGQARADTGPLKFTFDNSPPDGTPGVLLTIIEGDAARQLARLTATERRQTVLGSFTRFFGPKAGSPVDYIEQDWSREQWTRGCYLSNLPTGVWTQYGPALRAPIGRIHWAGAETATVWIGYMDGAVQSGERAAAEVLGSSD